MLFRIILFSISLALSSAQAGIKTEPVFTIQDSKALNVTMNSLESHLLVSKYSEEDRNKNIIELRNINGTVIRTHEFQNEELPRAFMFTPDGTKYVISTRLGRISVFLLNGDQYSTFCVNECNQILGWATSTVDSTNTETDHISSGITISPDSRYLISQEYEGHLGLFTLKGDVIMMYHVPNLATDEEEWLKVVNNPGYGGLVYHVEFFPDSKGFLIEYSIINWDENDKREFSHLVFYDINGVILNRVVHEEKSPAFANIVDPYSGNYFRSDAGKLYSYDSKGLNEHQYSPEMGDIYALDFSPFQPYVKMLLTFSKKQTDPDSNLILNLISGESITHSVTLLHTYATDFEFLDYNQVKFVGYSASHYGPLLYDTVSGQIKPLYEHDELNHFGHSHRFSMSRNFVYASRYADKEKGIPAEFRLMRVIQ